jgi:hypothetical protein
MPRWIEGEPAGIVEVWGADWRQFRPQLAAALADPDIGLDVDAWVTLQSLTERTVVRFPALLGPSFRAATARLAGEAGAGQTEDEARAAALADVVAFELSGPFVWFSWTRISDRPGMPRAVTRSAFGLAKKSQGEIRQEPLDAEVGRPLTITESGEVALLQPSPNRVWALSAFTELVDLGPVSHFRLSEDAVVQALGSGVHADQIVSFLQRASGDEIPDAVHERITNWSRALQRADIHAAYVIRVESPRAAAFLHTSLQGRAWTVQFLDEKSLLILARHGHPPDDEGIRLQEAVRAAGHLPHWPGDAESADEMAHQETTTAPDASLEADQS